ncbi:MAG TPA: rhodanese-like domain-containing protein [Gemmatimonadales bacterium]|nr:rhodanese-like domain-containing protein [Gemmatimonadales bacterium]
MTKEPSMDKARSLVLEVPPPTPEASRDFLAARLAFHTDAWDVAEDLKRGIDQIVVVDARSRAAYARGHIPGAISFPHREMTGETTRDLDPRKTYVVYCDGIGCNASTKGAYRLAALGFRVKELLGGLDFWLRDGHPVARGEEAGQKARVGTGIACGCA